MKTENTKFRIDLEDLQTLYLYAKNSYCPNLGFEDWKKECKEAYEKYLINRVNPKTFSQWVNFQIIALTT